MQAGKADATCAFEITQKEQLLAAVHSAAGGKAGLAAALQAKLDSLVGKSSGYIETLPLKIQDRVNTLQEIQTEYDELEEKFQVRATNHFVIDPNL